MYAYLIIDRTSDSCARIKSRHDLRSEGYIGQSQRHKTFIYTEIQCIFNIQALKGTVNIFASNMYINCVTKNLVLLLQLTSTLTLTLLLSYLHGSEMKGYGSCTLIITISYFRGPPKQIIPQKTKFKTFTLPCIIKLFIILQDFRFHF